MISAFIPLWKELQIDAKNSNFEYFEKCPLYMKSGSTSLTYTLASQHVCCISLWNDKICSVKTMSYKSFTLGHVKTRPEPKMCDSQNIITLHLIWGVTDLLAMYVYNSIKIKKSLHDSHYKNTMILSLRGHCTPDHFFWLFMHFSQKLQHIGNK